MTPMAKFNDGERFSRLQQLNDKLRKELELVREENRVVSESMAVDSKDKARRSTAARAASAAAKKRASARAASTHRRTRKTS